MCIWLVQSILICFYACRMVFNSITKIGQPELAVKEIGVWNGMAFLSNFLKIN